MSTSVSILAEIPEQLHESLKEYLETHPNWDQDQVFAAALSFFLLHNQSAQPSQISPSYKACAQIYLETLLQK